MATGATHKCCCPPPSNQSLGYMTTPSSQKEGKYKVWIDMKSESHSAVWEDGTPTPPPSLGLVMAAIIIPVCVCVCVWGIYLRSHHIPQRILGFFTKALPPAMYSGP